MTSSPAAAHGMPPLVVVGASVRAFAESAHRAGWAVHAADLFRDLDVVAVAREAVRVTASTDESDGYPRGLVTAASRFPAGAPWCYTGGLENHPDLIASLAAVRPLAGTPAEVVRRIRDPASLAAAVEAAGFAFPATSSSPAGLPTDGSYLLKPLAGAGGRGILSWTDAAAAAWSRRHGNATTSTHRWQRHVAGAAMSAGFVMSAGSSRLLGVTRQLVGAAWCHASRFAWCGGVVDDSPQLHAAFARLGVALAAEFRPAGVIGVDAVLDRDGMINVVEVNPRPTASMELFERADGTSIASCHLSACGHRVASARTSAAARPAPGWRWAKGVLFADRPVAVTPPLVDSLRRTVAGWTNDDAGWSALADIPAAGQIVAAGSPVCTIFARAGHPDEALDALRDRVATVDRLLDSAAGLPMPAAER